MKTNSQARSAGVLMLLIPLGAAMFLTTLTAKACGSYEDLSTLQELARDAVSADPHVAEPAVALLRREGLAGLEALLRVHDEPYRAKLIGVAFKGPEAQEFLKRVIAAMDKVSGQKDSYASRLYWFTDLEQAGRVAAAEGKPILSLRLLGRLDEDLSCANSRFFRTALYANAEVSSYLRSKFVLHWESVRPVPRLTIDFGDGRKLERTITGNSIHYVLTPDGAPVDALPGVYGPDAFQEALRRAEALALQLMAEPQDAASSLRAHHQRRSESVAANLNAQLLRIGRIPVPEAMTGSDARDRQTQPNAVDAARIAPSKRAIEPAAYTASLVRTPGASPSSARTLDDVTWQKLGELHAEEARLDAASRELMKRKTLTAREAARIAFSKARVEDPLLRTVLNFERSMAEDTVRNEYDLHLRIHDWFARALSETGDVTALNKKVYAELFLMPDSDPWLGLKPADVYSALDRGGELASDSSR